MQSIVEQRMNKKRITVTGKRQITIPIEFYNQLGIEKEVECYVQNGRLILHPAVRETGGEFAEQILEDLVSQGLSGEKLLRRFRETNRAIRPAVERMIDEADDIAAGKKPYATMADVFGDVLDPEGD